MKQFDSTISQHDCWRVRCR